MTKLLNLLGGCCCLWAIVLAVVEPINLGRLPQAAPSLSSQATEPVSRLGPDGLQSTIAGDAQ